MEAILIVEDDENISEMISDYLVSEGYSVEIAGDGMEAMKVYEENTFDLILLDLMIPKIEGMRVMKNIREKSLTPIIIMSAKDSDADKAMGLMLGADDYLTKPFSLVELSARIKANIRRATKYIPDVFKTTVNAPIQIGDLNLDIQNFTVKKCREEIKLTSKEFEILRLFASNLGRVFTKAQIYKEIWQEEYYGDDNVINVHIRRLREKIEEDPKNPVYIKTIWGIGYKMEEV